MATSGLWNITALVGHGITITYLLDFIRVRRSKYEYYSIIKLRNKCGMWLQLINAKTWLQVTTSSIHVLKFNFDNGFEGQFNLLMCVCVCVLEFVSCQPEKSAVCYVSLVKWCTPIQYIRN